MAGYAQKLHITKIGATTLVSMRSIARSLGTANLCWGGVISLGVISQIVSVKMV